MPFYPNIYALSGYPAVRRVALLSSSYFFPKAVAKYGPAYSYDLAPRAQIFRRDASSVQDIDDFKTLLRYNGVNNSPQGVGCH